MQWVDPTSPGAGRHRCQPPRHTSLTSNDRGRNWRCHFCDRVWFVNQDSLGSWEWEVADLAAS